MSADMDGHTRPMPDRGEVRVLVIDDEAPIRLLCRVNLEAEGITVLEAADGTTGLDLARELAKVVPETLDLVGLGGKEKRYPHELSGGEQQRVAIARAFVNRPPILLADEPTGNLDPTTSLGIMKLLDRINRTGTTIVMATHDDEIVDQMRKRVIELQDGKLVRDQSRGVYGSER